jgi:hypothetical protein
MKKLLLLLSLSAVVVLLFAPVASAQQNLYASPTASAMASPTASATATATATATASPLPSTGGPELMLPVTLVATLALIGSGFGALALVRR